MPSKSLDTAAWTGMCFEINRLAAVEERGACVRAGALTHNQSLLECVRPLRPQFASGS